MRHDIGSVGFNLAQLIAFAFKVQSLHAMLFELKQTLYLMHQV